MTAAKCWWCHESTANPVRVGFVPGDSGPGWTIHACPTCQRLRQIMPIDEHPPGSDGRPRVRPGKWKPIE